MNRDSADPTQGRHRRRNQQDRQARATETAKNREVKLASQTERYRERREQETAEQSEARLSGRREIDRGRRAQARSQETAEQYMHTHTLIAAKFTPVSRQCHTMVKQDVEF